MGFLWKEQGFIELAGEIRFKRRDLLCIDALEAARPAGKPGELWLIARAGHDQRPPLYRNRNRLSPKLERFASKVKNWTFRVFGLTLRRKHSPCEAGAAKARSFLAFGQFDIATCAGKLKGNG